MLLAPPLPPPPAERPLVGPVLPSPKLPRTSAVPVWVAGGIRAVLREIPGAVVVVEDSAPAYLPLENPEIRAFRGFLKLRLASAIILAPQPYAVRGMDPAEIWAGGNRVHKTYPMVSVGF